MAYRQHFEFDDHQLDRIAHLLLLKGFCLEHQTQLQKNYSLENDMQYTSFFLGISDETDALIYNFVNDEATSCFVERGPTERIFDVILERNRKREDFPTLWRANEDYQSATYNYRDRYVGRCYLDFTIGTYSTFEFWMSKIYVALRANEPELPSKRKTKLKEFIKEYNDTMDEALQEQLLEKMGKVGGGQSGAGEIDFVFSKIKSYTRPSMERDRQFIRSYAALRNTVHNMGVSKAPIDYELKGEDFHITLPSGLPSYKLDHSDSARMCAELARIYAAVIDSLNIAGQPCCMDIIPSRL
ncbi:hypothetical protein [Pseudomonas sp. PDM25]|uniref:hypothetical protein n=1 Tax=Pseudomonas sp. PDM25 TaxID=2854772 RepID=UPI001C436B97|nr:hypothetical protein [Pseudomonas sp. PDM25]MBV7514381.1 hypothetical protein [Pseudomonas sp. PDM25]